MIMISGFVAGVSPALEEAAQIDGCSVRGAITKIVVPTIAPGLVAAGCVMALIPVILLFAYIQKYLVSGLSAGAVKG